jgi:hypothetical protein
MLLSDESQMLGREGRSRLRENVAPAAAVDSVPEAQMRPRRDGAHMHRISPRAAFARSGFDTRAVDAAVIKCRRKGCLEIRREN